MRTLAPRLVRRVLVCAVVLMALTGTGGCGESSVTAGTDGSASTADELAMVDGEPCPATLPIDEDPSGHGFGVEQPAEDLPALPDPDAAWVCMYVSFKERETPNGGMELGWKLSGEPKALSSSELVDLGSAMGQVTTPDRAQGCNDDLGPRWLLSYSQQGDLTGIVVDDFGCREVRLTDNPHITPPGESSENGLVRGVLTGGFALLDAVGVGKHAASRS